ncbi:TPA: acetyl-CoA C-acetyltransferase [Candidatus Poribacteria bacterium]|nr:acetyl-CoA C-acetyltransferase [Candidatus Poribacteria bacterium]
MSSVVPKVVIVKATRTAIGSFGGSLKELEASQLGAILIDHIIKTSDLEKDLISEVIMGQVYTAGCGLNPARIASIKAGLPYSVPATTVNQVCGSGLKSIIMGTESILADESKVVIAGGMESMSQTPFLVSGQRWGHKMGHLQMTDSIIKDGLSDPFHHCHMGITAENLAHQYKLSRQEQDEFACYSQQKYQQALRAGLFTNEIVPIEIPRKKNASVVFDRDEHPRAGVSIDSLARLKPSFQDDGTVTAGNSSGINDGASAVLMMTEDKAKQLGLEIMSAVKAYATVGVDPKYMGIGPVYAIRQLLTKVGSQLDKMDLFELNEAFAAQSLAVIKELGLDWSKVNLNGGAIALGHPLGASGARITTTLLHLMKDRNLRLGISSLCIGGGMGIAVLFERS